MKILFLDDDEARHAYFAGLAFKHSVDHVRTAEEAIQALRENQYDLACLDHDLGGRIYVDPLDLEGTGYTVAKAMSLDLGMKRPSQVVVHSFNPVGVGRMVNRLKAAGFNVVAAPFGSFRIPDPE